MLSSPPQEFANSLIQAALTACKRRQQAKSKRLFDKFQQLLKEHKLCAPETVVPTAIEAPAGAVTADKFPNDVIPLNLSALANCWRQQNLVDQADDAIGTTVDIIEGDRRLAFLRQNVFQEAAKYYSQSEQYDKADDLLGKQLSIVKVKGSKVLTDFVTINWLINRGNLHEVRGEFTEAESSYQKALTLIESEWEPRREQVELLHTCWSKLEERLNVKSGAEYKTTKMKMPASKKKRRKRP